MTRSPLPGMEAPLLCELHAHSTWSDGHLPLEQVVDLCGRRGFDVLCSTDHVVRGREMLTEDATPPTSRRSASRPRGPRRATGCSSSPGSS